MRQISESDRIQIEAAIAFMAEDASVPCITVALTTVGNLEAYDEAEETDTITVQRGETIGDVLTRIGYIDPATLDPRRQDLYVGRPDYDPYERSFGGFDYRRFDNWPKWLRDVVKYTSATHSSHVAAAAMAAGVDKMMAQRAQLEALKEFHDVRPRSVPGRERKAGRAWSLEGLGRRVVRGARGRRGRHLYD